MTYTKHQAPSVCGTRGLENHTQNSNDFSDNALRRLGEQVSALHRLEMSASRFGIKVYPLDGDTVYMSADSGFHCIAPDLRAATAVIRQLGSAHG